jgi:HAD superfamily hydrolase (TIGR01662 family)
MKLKAAAFDLGNTLIAEGTSLRLTPMPGVVDTLAALDGQMTLCVASNSTYPIGHTVELLEEAGIRPYFQHVFSSATLGAAKPDAAFFAQMLAILGIQPAECVMVGDSYLNDIMGAKGAGLFTVWLTRQTSANAPHADVVVSSMQAALDAIHSLDVRLEAG